MMFWKNLNLAAESFDCTTISLTIIFFVFFFFSIWEGFISIQLGTIFYSLILCCNIKKIRRR